MNIFLPLFSDQDDISIDTQYVRITLKEFPGKLAVISRLKKETFVTGNKGEVIKSHIIPQCTVNIPEGSVNPGTMLDLQVTHLLASRVVLPYSIRDEPYWTSRKNSLELMELSSINKVSLA